jgi:hypothetical protein
VPVAQGSSASENTDNAEEPPHTSPTNGQDDVSPLLPVVAPERAIDNDAPELHSYAPSLSQSYGPMRYYGVWLGAILAVSLLLHGLTMNGLITAILLSIIAWAVSSMQSALVGWTMVAYYVLVIKDGDAMHATTEIINLLNDCMRLLVAR